MDDSIPTSDNVNDVQWDGPKYEATLAHLERLQEKIDALRNTLPAIITPMGQPGLSKVNVFQKVKAAAINSTDELSAFRELWKFPETQTVLSKAHESFDTDSDLSKASGVQRYGWDKSV